MRIAQSHATQESISEIVFLPPTANHRNVYHLPVHIQEFVYLPLKAAGIVPKHAKTRVGIYSEYNQKLEKPHEISVLFHSHKELRAFGNMKNVCFSNVL